MAGIFSIVYKSFSENLLKCAYKPAPEANQEMFEWKKDFS